MFQVHLAEAHSEEPSKEHREEFRREPQLHGQCPLETCLKMRLHVEAAQGVPP